MEIRVEYDGDMECAQCGSSLEFDWDDRRYRFVVIPCSDCLSDATESGRNEGYDEGHDIGYDEGYDTGYGDGKGDEE